MFIIATDLRDVSGKVHMLRDGPNGNIRTYNTRQDAIDEIVNLSLDVFPCKILDVDKMFKNVSQGMRYTSDCLITKIFTTGRSQSGSAVTTIELKNNGGMFTFTVDSNKLKIEALGSWEIGALEDIFRKLADFLSKV